MTITTAMRNLALGAVLFTAAAGSAYAQGGESPKAAPDAAPVPPELSVAPTASKRVPEPVMHGGGKPANICQELVAFVEQRTQSASQGAVVEQGAPKVSPVLQAPSPVDVPQQKSGIAAPVPAPESAKRPQLITLEQARAYLNGSDLLACQEAARHMRRTGVPMPDGLIALAALRPDLLKAALEGR